MHMTVIVDNIEYQVAHMNDSMYELDGKKYGPESYLVRGPKDEYYKAMTVEEYKEWEKGEGGK